MYGAQPLKDLLKLLPDTDEVLAGCMSGWRQQNKQKKRPLSPSADEEAAGVPRQPGQADAGGLFYVPAHPGAEVSRFLFSLFVQGLLSEVIKVLILSHQ